MNPHRLRAYAFMLATVVIWGLASPIIKLTLEGISALPFLTYRFLISSIPFVIILFISKPKIPKSLPEWLYLLLYCLFTSTFALGFLFFGLEKTTVLDTSLITVIAPLATTAAGVIFLKERVTFKEKVGLITAILGTIFTFVGPLLKMNGDEKLSGNVLIFVYLFFAVITAVMAKVLLRKGYPPFQLAQMPFLIGFLTLLPFVLTGPGLEGFITTIKDLDFKYQSGVLFMALVSGNLAYYFSNRAQKTIEVGEASLFGYISPVISVLAAVIFLKETITPLFVIGAVFIAIGVGVAEYKKPKFVVK